MEASDWKYEMIFARRLLRISWRNVCCFNSHVLIVSVVALVRSLLNRALRCNGTRDSRLRDWEQVRVESTRMPAPSLRLVLILRAS